MKRKNIIIIVLSFLLFCCLILLLFKCCSGTENDNSAIGLKPDDNAVKWNGEQQLEKEKTDKKEIAIPGYNSLVFIENQTAQKVNFYNPQSNNCLFVFQLYINGSLLWESGYCPPGNGYYSIELKEPLQKGDYSGNLKIQCYRATGEQLNGANIAFDLKVIQED